MQTTGFSISPTQKLLKPTQQVTRQLASQLQGNGAVSGDVRFQGRLAPQKTAFVPSGLGKVYFGIGRPADKTAITNILASSIQTAQLKKLHEVIPFDQYLDRITQNPKLVRNSVQRIYDMIMSKGRERIELDNGKIGYRYKLFTSPSEPKYAISGMEEPLDKLVGALGGAARGTGLEKRIFLLVGPVGTAKTTVVEVLKNELEVYTKSDEGALFGTQFNLKGLEKDPLFKDLFRDKDASAVRACQVFDDPFKLIPNEPDENGVRSRQEIVNHLNEKLRADAEAAGNKSVAYTLNAKGSVCPSCNDIFNRLVQKYDGDMSKVMQHVEAKRVVLSEKDRVGLTTFRPKDSKDQTTDELTGSVNYRKLVQSGSDSDPQSFDYDGAFGKSNRGLSHFDEIFKMDKVMLNPLLNAAEFGDYSPSKFPDVEYDGLILGTTNIPDWEKLRNDKHLEAIRSRVLRIDVPYNSKVNDEVNIYQKDFGKKAQEQGLHVSPHVLSTAALWRVMTGLTPPKNANLTLLQKALLYNGRKLPGFTETNVRELRQEAAEGGIENKKGMSPRDIQNALGGVMQHPEVVDDEIGTHCVSPFLVIDALKAQLGTGGVSNVSKDEQESYSEMLTVAEGHMKHQMILDVRRALSGSDKDIEKEFNYYKSNLIAWSQREMIKDPVTGKLRPPDEEHMRAIEIKMDIPESRKDDFRREIMNQIAVTAVRGEEFTYQTNERLRKSIEEVLVDKHKDGNLSLASLGKDTANSEVKALENEVKDRMVRDGYCPHCADIAIAVFADPTNR